MDFLLPYKYFPLGSHVEAYDLAHELPGSVYVAYDQAFFLMNTYAIVGSEIFFKFQNFFLWVRAGSWRKLFMIS